MSALKFVPCRISGLIALLGYFVLCILPESPALVPAFAADPKFPSRPISLIVPWPPGGSTDRHLRVFAEVASKYLGQPLVVVNTPGAGGTLGPASMAAQAKPDG